MILENESQRRSRVINPAPYGGFGKLPPQAVDIEEAVLGAIMVERDAFIRVADILKPEMLYKDPHQKIYTAITNLFNDNAPIDILTVTNQLRRQGELELIGGAYFITELTNRVASAANIEFHARIIIQKFIQRELIRISTDVIQDAYEDTTDALDLLELAERNIFDISQNKKGKQITKAGTLVKDCIEVFKTPVENGLTGIPSGLNNLDKLTHGWQNTDLIIIAARPAMGKTALALHLAKHPAINLDKPVLIFSLEMSEVQLVNRMISDEAHVPQEKLQTRTLDPYEIIKIESLTRQLVNAPLFIDDTPALTTFDFRAKSRRMKQQHDIQLIIIDYLQLMVGKGGNREQEIGSISRTLKTVAKELNVPVIALSQLSRAVETRAGGGKRPMLSDLRESGSIEQDADMVIFLYRGEYYGLTEIDGESCLGLLELIIAKHRKGQCDTAKLDFNGIYMSISDWKAQEIITEGFKIQPSNSFNDKNPF